METDYIKHKESKSNEDREFFAELEIAACNDQTSTEPSSVPETL